MVPSSTTTRSLAPFVPRLVRAWLGADPDTAYREVDGTLALLDISGFTRLTERLSGRGKVGAEELTEVLDRLFTGLLEVASRDGAFLLKWGGDAVLLLFEGAQHPARAARAAARMRVRLERFGRVRTPRGAVTLQLSAGLHSGRLTFFLVGDPQVHRELIVCGPAASRTAELQTAARPGEIALSPDTAAALPAECVERVADLSLLVAEPTLTDLSIESAPAAGADLDHALSPPVREYLRAAEFGAEHRKVAVGFVRFSGTDALLAEAGPTALAAALDDCVRNVQHSCARHGVTFLESDLDRDGGKIMIVAGAPRTGGHDEDRLLRTAWQIVNTPTTLTLQVGANRGAVFTGVLGPAFSRAYSVKGDAVNVAARLAAHAGPGQALCTQPMLEHSRTAFRFEELPPLQVKGKSAPVQAALLGAPVDVAAPAAPGAGALVGRDVELSALQSALHQAIAGAGALVEVVGEPGIGKTHLVRTALSDVEVPVHVVTCDEYETATPYWPFRALITAVLGLDPAARDPDVFRAAVAARDPDLVAWLPLLARIVDVEVPTTPEVEALGEQFRVQRLYEVATQLLTAALPGPVVVLFEDVHLMDDASAALLQHLARDVQRRPWLLVVTRREIAEGFRPEGAAIVSVRPAPLDHAAAERLVQTMGAAAVLPLAVIESLTARAGGNPLFLRGLVGAMVEGADIDALPDTVEALITSQLDRLSAPALTALRYGSVLGMRFDRTEWQALVGDRALPGDSDEPEATRRIGDFLRVDGESVRFTHQLVRDTAYESLPYRTRRTLHGAAGDLLEERAAEPDDIAEVLSLHFAQAQRPDKTWHYARIGGERAAAKYAYAQAEELYARAVHAAGRVADVPAADLVAVNTALGDARYRIGRQEQALEAFRAARRRLHDDPVQVALLLRREASIEYRRGRLRAGLSRLTRGLKQLDDDPAAHPAVRSRLEGMYAGIRYQQGQYEQALTWARRAERHAEESGDLSARAEALQAVLTALAMLGYTTETATYAHNAVALYEQLGDRAGQSRALNNLAMLAWLDGHGAQALDTFRRAVQLATEAGDTANAATFQYNVGDVLLHLGQAEAARDLLRALLPTLRSFALDDWVASATRALGAAIALSGSLDEGIELLQHARERLDDLDEPTEVVETDAALALVHLMRGMPDVAADVAAKAAQRAEALDAVQLSATLLRVHGGALSDLGNLIEARSLLVRALEIADKHSRGERGFVLAELGRLEHRLGRRDPAADYAERAGTALAELGYAGSERYPMA